MDRSSSFFVIIVGLLIHRLHRHYSRTSKPDQFPSQVPIGESEGQEIQHLAAEPAVEAARKLLGIVESHGYIYIYILDYTYYILIISYYIIYILGIINYKSGYTL